MRIISFLVPFLFFSTFSAAYTVVMKSGKTVEGKLIGEDSATIQLKEENGFVLSFRKSSLDLAAMILRNDSAENQPKAPEWVMVQGSRRVTRSLVQVAEECRKSRTGKGRVLNMQDLADTPQLSIIGSETNVAVKPAAVARQDEQFWRKSAVSLKKELAAEREKRLSAEIACVRARERQSAKLRAAHRNVIDLSALYEDPPECNRLREADRRLIEATDRWEHFEERARRAEVPWQWLQ
jgi:hypothetical protein